MCQKENRRKKVLKTDNMLHFNGKLEAWWNVCCKISPVVRYLILSDFSVLKTDLENSNPEKALQ